MVDGGLTPKPTANLTVQHGNDEFARWRGGALEAAVHIDGAYLLSVVLEARIPVLHGEARDQFLRAAAVHRIARFPINRSALSQEAWEKGKAAYELGGQLLDPPSVTVDIPFTHADTSAGDLDVPIAAYLRLPKGAKPADGWPVLLFICGLDAYRTDHTPRTQAHVDHGLRDAELRNPGYRRLSRVAERPGVTRPAHEQRHRLGDRERSGIRV